MAPPPPWLAAQLAALAAGGVAVSRLRSGGPPGSPVDRFAASTPFCGAHVAWEVVLNASAPATPPDFHCASLPAFRALPPAVDADAEATAAADALAAQLRAWQPRKADALLTLLLTLRGEYARQQRRAAMQIASQDARIGFELSTLGDAEGLELGVGGPPAGGAAGERTLWLSLPLPLDLAPLAPALRGGADVAPANVACQPRLLAAFALPAGGQAARALRPRLYLPDALAAVLGAGAAERCAPEWRPETCLVEYAPAVAAALQERIAHFTRPDSPPPPPAPPPPAPLPIGTFDNSSGDAATRDDYGGEAAAGGDADAAARPTLWAWVERSAGAARAAAGAALDAALDARALDAAPPRSSSSDAEAAGAPAADVVTSALPQQPVPPPPPSAREQRAAFWDALAVPLGAPLEVEAAELACAMYLVSAADGTPLLLEVSLPREGFAGGVPPALALSALESGTGSGGGGAGGTTEGGPASPPPRRPPPAELRWSGEWSPQEMAARLAENVAQRAAAWDAAQQSPP